MTDDELAEIERIWAEATPGPWKWSTSRTRDWNAASGQFYERDFYHRLAVVSDKEATVLSADRSTGEVLVGAEDESAIGNAPEHIAALLAEVKRLRAGVQEIAGTLSAEASAGAHDTLGLTEVLTRLGAKLE